MFLFCFVTLFLFSELISFFLLFNLTFENLISHIFSYSYDNYSMLPDVPECSGICSMFLVLSTA